MKIVNSNYEKNMSGLFAAAFSFEETQKVASIDFGADDVCSSTHLEKTAGIRIDNADEQSAKESILRYVTNELTAFPFKLGVTIELIPVSLDKSRANAISDAQGSVNITHRTKVFSLPFLIQQGELLPFDVIESEGQRVPFSRENLAKVVNGIERWHREVEQNGGMSSNGFKSVEPPLNAATTPGFMGDVMSIRDQHMQRRGPSNLTTVASEYGLDTLLEKTAGMKPLSDQEATAIATVLNEKAIAQAQEYFDKLASEDMEFEKIANIEERKLEEFQELPFRDVSECKHGDIVLFSEQTKEDEFITSKAIVLKQFRKLKSQLKPMTLLLSTDGRIRILMPGEKFKCVVSPNETFKVSKVDVASLNHDDVFIAIDGDDVVTPCVVEKALNIKRERVDHNGRIEFSETQEKLFELRELADSHMIEQYVNSDIKENQDGDVWEKGRLTLFNLIDTAFTFVGYNDFLDKKSKELGLDLGSTQEIYPKHRVCNSEWDKDGRKLPFGPNVLCADEHFRVIKVTGKIGESLDINERLHQSAPLSKVASVSNLVRVECIDRSLKLYDISIWFKDDGKRMFNARKKDFKRVSEGKAKAILRIIKFTPQDVSNIMYKAKNGRYEERQLPGEITTADINMLEGGAITNISAQNVKNTVNRLVNPQAIATAAATAVTTDLIMDVIKNRAMAPGGKKVVNTIYKGLRNVVASSEEIFSEFEKIAATTQSKDMLTVAKAVCLSSKYLDKVANVINEDEIYPEIRKVSREILSATPLFEKVAFDLVEFNRSQFRDGQTIVAPNVLVGAMNSLDTMYKIANVVDKTKPMEKVLDIEV